MPTSYEIASMFAQQNQMFLGQAQFSQSIGVPTPPQFAPGGLAGFGIGGPQRSHTGGFNYGASGMMGYGAGNQISAGMMSFGGAALQGGLSIGGGLGMMALAGSGVGLPIAAGAMLAHAGVGAMMGGAHQQASMNTMLGSQYNFANPMSRSGSGFTRDDAKSIGDMARSLSHIPEMMTSFEEIQGIMSRMKSSGVMQGVKNASDFQSKFREALSTIRETAKILGTTMEEAEQFFSSSRSSGFYNRASQMKNVMSAQFTSAVTGATVGQVAGLQQAGADMAMSFGARRGLGATAVTNIAQNIGLAQASGRLREGAVEDVTGLQGPEAHMALAQKMFGGMMRFGQTAAGRLAMAGMMKYDESGRAIGVDESMAKRFNAGELSIEELKARASTLTDAQKKSFTARQSDLVASLAGQIGPGGAFTMMKGALGLRGDDDGTNLILQRLTGMSAGEVDIAEGMQGVSGDMRAGSFARMRQRQAGQRERTDPSAIMQKIKTRIHGATVGKLEQVGADVQNAIAKSVDEFFDDMVGREVSTLTEERASSLAKAFSGANSQQAKEMLAGLTKTGSVSTGGGRGGTMGSLSVLSKGMLGGGLGGPLGGLALGGREFVRQFGGSDSGIARFLAGLGGGMTEGQESDVAKRIFGTDSASGQSALAARFRSGDVAGRGAEAALSSIMANEDMMGKSNAQKAEIITDRMKSRVYSAAGKLPAGFRDPDQIKAMSRDTLEAQMKASNLSEEEKGVLRSFQDAAKNNAGGSVFAQMAAASGAGNIMASAVVGGGRSSKALQEALRSSEQALTESIGDTAASFVKGSSKNAKAFSEVAKDETLRVALAEALETGDFEKARKMVNSKLGSNEKMSEQDIRSLAEASKGFEKKGANVTAAQAALKSYADNANAVASKEFFKNVSKQGQDLIDTAMEGSKGDLQRALGSAMSGFEEKLAAAGGDEKARDAVISELRSKFSAFSDSFEGMSQKQVQEALSVGGSTASQAYSAFLKKKKFGKKRYGSVEEVAKDFGVDVKDVYAQDFKPGQQLSKEAIDRLTSMTGLDSTLVDAQGGVKGEKAKSKDDKLIEVLDKQLVVLSKLSTNMETKNESWFSFGSTKENANAGEKGQTKMPGAQ